MGNDTADLLNATGAFVKRFIVLRQEAERIAVPLWVLHTHAIEAAEATPYLWVKSPQRRSGKSRLIDVLASIVARPHALAGISEAALFRIIEAERPTLLMDEMDAAFNTHSDRTEPLRGIINAGNRRGQKVYRCEGPKSQVRGYEVFCPKVLAGIDNGKLPDTIRDRSIPISMQRKLPGEQVERLRWRDVGPQAAELVTWGEDWAGRYSDALSEARPKLPEKLDDRAADGWEPLFAIADLAGGAWPEDARRAALALSNDADDLEDSYGVLILAAIKPIIGDRASSHDLLAAINADEELPFGGWRGGDGLDGRGLARLLRPYGIRPRTIRLEDGSTPKGYLAEQFDEAFSRYLSEAPQEQHTPQPHLNGKADVADVADVAAFRGVRS